MRWRTYLCHVSDYSCPSSARMLKHNSWYDWNYIPFFRFRPFSANELLLSWTAPSGRPAYGGDRSMTSSGYGNNKSYAGWFQVPVACGLFAYQVTQMEAIQPASNYHYLPSPRILYILATCLSMLQKVISRTFFKAAQSRAYVLWKTNWSENPKVLDMPNSRHWRDSKKHCNSIILSFRGGISE